MATHHGKEGVVTVGGTAIGNVTGFTIDWSKFAIITRLISLLTRFCSSHLEKKSTI